MEKGKDKEGLDSRILPWIALFCVLWGSVFLTAWIFHLRFLLQIIPDSPAIHVNTCLSFIIGGVAFWGGAKKRMGLCVVFGSVITLASAGVVSEYLLRGDWGLQTLLFSLASGNNFLAETKMGPYTALSFLLVGLMFVLLGTFPRKSWSNVAASGWGPAVAIAAMGFSGYLLGSESLEQWVHFMRMSFPSSVGLLIMAVGAIGLAFRGGFDLPDIGFWPRSLPFAGTLSVTATIILSQALSEHNRWLVENLVRAKTTEIQHRFQSELGGYVGVLERTALRRRLYGSKSLGARSEELDQYRRRYPAFLAFAWSDTAMNLYGTVPREGIPLAGEHRFGDGEKLPSGGPDKRSEAVSALTLPSDAEALNSGASTALAISVPFRDSAGNEGFSVGLVATKELLEYLLRSEAGAGYEWELRLDETPIYLTGPPDKKSLPREIRFQTSDRQWKLTAYPTRRILRDLFSPIPVWTLVTGLFTALLFSLSVYLAQLNYGRVRQLQGANLELRRQQELLRQALTAQTAAETASREATEVVRRSEERFRALIHNSHDVVQLVSSRGEIIYESPSVTRVLGYLPEEMVGKKATDFMHPDEMETMLAIFRQSLASEDDSPSVEIRIRHKDGSWRWIEAKGMNMTHRPEVGAFVVNYRDITDRKRAENAMRASEEHFRGLIQNSHDVIQLLSRDGILVYTTPSITNTLGYTREETLGNLVFSFMHPDEAEQIARRFTDLQRKPGATVSAEVKLRHKDGSWHWMEVTATNLLETTAIGAIVVNLRDINDRKEAQEEIRLLKDSLELKVVERTGQLESAVLELEAFSYSISHDLRAPLRHIGGFVILLQSKSAAGLDAQGLRYLDIIAESVKRMDGLISHLLAFSRMGRQELQKMRFSVSDMVRQCLKEVEQDCAGRNVSWKIGELPEAFGDPTLIRQVVANLVSNAVKFTKGRAQATIQIDSRPGEPGTVYFVRDNGVGFDMKYVDRLFGVFQRLHSTSEFEGTGIGLANVRRIVNRHGGEAWAEGVDGEGATFYFSLANG